MKTLSSLDIPVRTNSADRMGYQDVHAKYLNAGARSNANRVDRRCDRFAAKQALREALAKLDPVNDLYIPPPAPLPKKQKAMPSFVGALCAVFGKKSRRKGTAYKAVASIEAAKTVEVRVKRVWTLELPQS